MSPADPLPAGVIPAEVVADAVRAVLDDVRACSAGRPPPRGSWIAFRVEADGTVTPDVRLSDPEVDTCAARALARMRFPPPGGTVDVSYPPRVGDLGPEASLRLPTDDGGWIEVIAVGAVVDGVRPTRLLRYGPDGTRRTGPVPVERWLAWDGATLASPLAPVAPDRVLLARCATGCPTEDVDLVTGTGAPTP